MTHEELTEKAEQVADQNCTYRNAWHAAKYSYMQGYYDAIDELKKEAQPGGSSEAGKSEIENRKSEIS